MYLEAISAGARVNLTDNRRGRKLPGRSPGISSAAADSASNTLYDGVKRTDPMGPKPLIFAPGPFSGTTVPAQPHAWPANSLLTGAIGVGCPAAISGGMKFAATTDHLEGKAESGLPLDQGWRSQIRDASKLWGAQTMTPEDHKKNCTTERSHRARSAEETLSRIAASSTNAGPGRRGFGAVMGL
jgi:aldehyde:ferredoxin oxidoreductase